MIRLSKPNAEDVLKWFFRETKERSAVRLSNIGDLIFLQVPPHNLRCYLQGVLCYSIGCFDACIAVGSMATEFHLYGRMREAYRSQKRRDGTKEVSSEGESAKELLQKFKKGRATYGELIRLVRTNTTFEAVASELPEHEVIDAIRTAHLHKNIRKLRKLYQNDIKAIAAHVPEREQEKVKNHIARLEALNPEKKALEVLRRASKILAPTVNQDGHTLEFERFHQRLFAPLLRD